MPLTSLNDYLTCHNAITQRRQHPRTTHTTRDQRLQVHTLQDVGFSLKQIQQLLPELSYDQVKYAAASERVTPRKRSGRPRELTEEDIDEIELFVVSSQIGRLMTYFDLSVRFSESWPFSVSEHQIRRALEARGYRRRVARQKPPLSEKNRRDRLAFAQAYKNWTREHWCLILWSDESWVQSGRHRKQWVTRRAGEELDPTCVLIRHQRKRGWMFWGSFHSGKKGPAVVWDKTWGKINSKSYCERVLPLLRNYLRDHPWLYFMQDNASAHGAQATREMMAQMAILTIHWPAYSPDLNPIETVWCWMKDYIEIRTGVNANLSYERLQRLVWEAWEAVPQSLLDELIDSMPARMQAVIDAGGGHTKF